MRESTNIYNFIVKVKYAKPKTNQKLRLSEMRFAIFVKLDTESQLILFKLLSYKKSL